MTKDWQIVEKDGKKYVINSGVTTDITGVKITDLQTGKVTTPTTPVVHTNEELAKQLASQPSGRSQTGGSKPSGTVTSFNPATGQYEVKGEGGKVVAAAPTPREASQKSFNYIFRDQPFVARARGEGGFEIMKGKPPTILTGASESRIVQKEMAGSYQGIADPVSMSVREAYEAGVISRNALENYERSGVTGLVVSHKVLVAARKARKAYPVASLPETHSSLSMVEGQQRHEMGMEQQKRDIIGAAAPMAQLPYELTEGWGGAEYAFSLAESRLTGKSFEVFQSERLAGTEAFISRGYKAAEKGGMDLWAWSVPVAMKPAAGLAMVMFPAAGTVAFTGMGIKQAAETVKEPSEENIVRTFLYAGTGLAAMSIGVMGGSMKASYAGWKAAKLETPKAGGFSLKEAKVIEPKALPEDTGLLVTKSRYEGDVLKTSGNIFTITQDVGKVSKPILEARDITFEAKTRLAKNNLVKTDIVFGEASRAVGKSMEKMAGGGNIESIFNEKLEVELTKGELIQIGRTGQKTLYGNELPKLELSEILSLGKKAKFTDFEIMQVKQFENQPSTAGISHKIVKLDTLLKKPIETSRLVKTGNVMKEITESGMLEVKWLKAGDIKLSKSGLSAFQERLKTQPFESLPKWPEKEWGKVSGIPENWPEINLLKMENLAKLQKGFDEAMKSFVSGMTKNKPGVEVKDIGNLEYLPGGIGKGFMKKLAEISEAETGEAFNLRPGDVKGMEVPKLKEAEGLRLGLITQRKTDIERMAPRMNLRMKEMLKLDIGPAIKEKLDISQDMMALLGTGTKTETMMMTETGIRQDVSNLLGIGTKTDIGQKLRMDVTARTKLGIEPMPPIKDTGEIPMTGKGLSIPSMEGERRRRKRMTFGFKVLVRRMGRWIELLDRPVSRSQAYGFGARYANENPSASFRVMRAGIAVKDIYDPTWDRIKNQFRPPKLKSRLPFDTQIERNRFRIDRPEEYRGITEKGIEASRLARTQRKGFSLPKPGKAWFKAGKAESPKFKMGKMNLGEIGSTRELMFGKRRKGKKKKKGLWDFKI